MLAMLLFTLIFNAIGWAIFTLTDLFLGSLPYVHVIMLAEWFVIPMTASAVYRLATGAEKFSDAREKTMYMLMWFVLGAGISGVICKAVEMGKWFEDSCFGTYDYLSFATAFILGFIVYSVLYEAIKFFVEGGFESRRIAKGH